MSNVKPLIIDKRNRVKGLFTYCQKCQRNIENRECGETGKRLSACKSTEKHMFKSIVAVPGTNGKKRKTRVFKTRDLNKAIQLKIEFEKELEANSYQNTDIHIPQENVKPKLLIECMAMYLAYLNNEGIAQHKVKIRSRGHIKDVERYFELFCKCLLINGLDHTYFKPEEINDQIVSIFHKYLIVEKGYANKTYNKVIALFRQFINWLINKKEYNIKNPFLEVVRKREIMDRTTITLSEFQLFLENISEEKGFKILPSGERKNQFRSWLPAAFQLALETGLRREEFMKIKFSDIEYDEKGNPILIAVQNYKVNRIQGNDESVGRIKYIPITKGLLRLLQSLGLAENKKSDKFLIGNSEKANRKTLIGFISKAFTHYWKLTGIEKNLQLRHLRKTYLTSLVDHFGDKASIISDHSSLDVLKKHYINDKQLVAAANDFEVLKR